METDTAPAVSIPELVAPRWHTAVLVAIFLASTLGGALFRHRTLGQPESSQRHVDVVPLYVSLIAMEWGLVLYVWKAGLRRTGTSLRRLVGARWGSARSVLVDVGLALLLLGIWKLVEAGWARGQGHDHATSIGNLLPRGPVEVPLWIGLAISAGFCEELVFRGYFQKQFEALARSRWIALLLQAALFGISHGYQGVQACLKIALYGILFGLLALWRRSLRPGMMAHAWTDIVGGLFGG